MVKPHPLPPLKLQTDDQFKLENKNREIKINKSTQ